MIERNRTGSEITHILVWPWRRRSDRTLARRVEERPRPPAAWGRWSDREPSANWTAPQSRSCALRGALRREQQLWKAGQ